MKLTEDQRARMDKARRERMMSLMKRPKDFCLYVWRRVRFMWWLTGNCRPQGVRQTREIRFWYGVRRLLRCMPEDRAAHRKAAQ